MLVRCASCNKQLNVPDSAAGKKARCPGCNSVFDVAAPTAVAVAIPKPPPLPPPDDDDQERPARRSRDDADDFDDDDRPRRRRPPMRNEERMAGIIATLLKTASFVLLGCFVINLINRYLSTAAVANFAKNINMRGVPNNPNLRINFDALAPSPMAAVVGALLVGGVIYGICVTFMLIGAAKASQLTGRGFVLAGLIIAIVLGSLMAIGAVVILIGMLSIFLSFMQVINLLACAGTSAMLLLAGIRGLALVNDPDVRAAFEANSERRPRRRRARDDDYDDDDEDRAPRRRRRSRDDED